ncbi:zinc-dependent alcohol dehydrogenase [Brevibacterium renqingii]|uniref:zinc-dependent alcohol dehydrogenase n=1 Tax=Brevibacterium renqingii TaxID=2776916 RepID=UPI001AE09CF1|nr:zinc-binding alcohol dehydrogenase [Brevibacterium renqingii]
MAWQYWTEAARQGGWREVPTPHADPRSGEEVRIRTTASAVSKGTETLVHTGGIPARIAGLMRAPHQLGEFPFPVSYGYLAVGIVDEGPAEWIGRRVFGLLPHHSHHVVPVDDIHAVPDGIGDHRALLAGAVETGINILWQHPPRIADRVAIVGAGMIGASTALLASRMPLDRLEVVDSSPSRRAQLSALGLVAVAPEEAAGDCDVVIHTSGHQNGLARGLEITGDDATLVEASWYGDDSPTVPLGADFHARRLSIIASQVGEVAAGHRARRTRRQRMQAAFRALEDDRFDALLTGSSSWCELPSLMEALCSGGELAAETLCHVIDYSRADEGADPGAVQAGEVTENASGPTRR